jgi:maltose phosphorylase
MGRMPNEWEITHEEIHRNELLLLFFNYYRLPVITLIFLKRTRSFNGIARFWHQRANFSKDKNQYVILGVTGPNEYENNVNNNFYTNFIAKWCIDYTYAQLQKVSMEFPSPQTYY